MKTIVVSGVNLVEAGPLVVMKECLKALAIRDDVKIIAIVNNSELYKDLPNLSAIEFISFSMPKKNWLLRVFFEYIYLYFYSRSLSIDIWLSMHDMTPWVKAKKQFVYCHNPAIFFKVSFKEAFFEPTFFLFSKFYQLIYKYRIHKNAYVIVQQQWIAQEFKKRFGIKRVLVAYPILEKIKNAIAQKNHSEKIIIFYPAIPRVFKNFEVIINACELLENKGVILKKHIEFQFTFDGTENRYALAMAKRCFDKEYIRLLGVLPHNEVLTHYNTADALIFPSKLETWGLPISEAKALGKPIILADLPYAHETMGSYDKACFFNPYLAAELALLLERLILGENIFSIAEAVKQEEKTVCGWVEFANFIIECE